MWVANIFIRGNPGPLQLHFKAQGHAENVSGYYARLFLDGKQPDLFSVSDDFAMGCTVRLSDIQGIFIQSLDGMAAIQLERALIQARAEAELRTRSPKLVIPENGFNQ